MLKRILALAAAAALAVTLSACGGNAVKLPVLTLEGDTASQAASGTVSESPEAVSQPDAAAYDDNLDGLCAYLEAGKAVIQDGTENSFTEMSYKEIGAVGGYRYRFTYNNSTVQAEFYEFDPDHLDERGQACLSSVREKGFFVVLDNEVRATLHPSGKYMMIYTDAKRDEKNQAQKERVEELFLGFKM